MSHFTGAFFDFLRDLKRHNDRDWFADNKARYVQDVQDPFSAVHRRFRAATPADQPGLCGRHAQDGRSMFRHPSRHRGFRRTSHHSRPGIAARFPHEARRKVEGGVPGFLPPPGSRRFFRGGGVYHIDCPNSRRSVAASSTNPGPGRPARQKTRNCRRTIEARALRVSGPRTNTSRT
jgi:uncharacterized protein (DUF2461 family)